MFSTTDIAKHLKEKVEGSSSKKTSRLLLLDSLCSGEQSIEEAIFDNE